MADPANDATKQALAGAAAGCAERAGGTVGQLSAKLARDVEKRRVSVAAWERDLMAMRYEVVDMAPGPVREAALAAYVGPGVGRGPPDRVRLQAAAGAGRRDPGAGRRGADAAHRAPVGRRARRALDAVAATRAAAAGNACLIDGIARGHAFPFGCR